MREAKLCFQDWLGTPSYDILGGIKWSYLTRFRAPETSPPLKDFRAWLRRLQKSFAGGSLARWKILLEGRETEGSRGGGTTTTFDDETLGSIPRVPPSSIRPTA